MSKMEVGESETHAAGKEGMLSMEVGDNCFSIDVS